MNKKIKTKKKSSISSETADIVFVKEHAVSGCEHSENRRNL